MRSKSEQVLTDKVDFMWDRATPIKQSCPEEVDFELAGILWVMVFKCPEPFLIVLMLTTAFNNVFLSNLQKTWYQDD